MEALQRNREQTKQAVQETRNVIFSPLLSAAQLWAQSFPQHGPESQAAMAHGRMIRYHDERFEGAALSRIEEVLTAATMLAGPRSSTKAEPARATVRSPGPGDQGNSRVAAEAYRRAMAKARRRAIIHGLIFTVGSLLTYAGASAGRSTGGGYIVFWGAILFGAVYCIRNVVAYHRLKTERDRALANDVTPGNTAPSRPAAQAPPRDDRQGLPTHLGPVSTAQLVSTERKDRTSVHVLLGLLVLAIPVALIFSIMMHTSAPTTTASPETAASASLGPSPSRQPAAASATASSAPKALYDRSVGERLAGDPNWHRINSDFYARWVPNDQYTCSLGQSCTQVWIETTLNPGCQMAEIRVSLINNGTAVTTEKRPVSPVPVGIPVKAQVVFGSNLVGDRVQLDSVICTD